MEDGGIVLVALLFIVSIVFGAILAYKFHKVQNKLEEVQYIQGHEESMYEQRMNNLDVKLEEVKQNLYELKKRSHVVVDQVDGIRTRLTELDKQTMHIFVGGELHDSLEDLVAETQRLLSVVEKIDALEKRLWEIDSKVGNFDGQLEDAHGTLSELNTAIDSLQKGKLVIDLNMNVIHDLENNINRLIESQTDVYKTLNVNYTLIRDRLNTLERRQSGFDTKQEQLSQLLSDLNIIINIAQDARRLGVSVDNLSDKTQDYNSLSSEAERDKTNIYQRVETDLIRASGAVNAALQFSTSSEVENISTRATELVRKINGYQRGMVSNTVGLGNVAEQKRRQLNEINTRLSSLDVNHDTLVLSFENQEFTNRYRATADKYDATAERFNNFTTSATTNMLCIDSTCINRDQLRAILNCGAGIATPPPLKTPPPVQTQVVRRFKIFTDRQTEAWGLKTVPKGTFFPYTEPSELIQIIDLLPAQQAATFTIDTESRIREVTSNRFLTSADNSLILVDQPTEYRWKLDGNGLTQNRVLVTSTLPSFSYVVIDRRTTVVNNVTIQPMTKVKLQSSSGPLSAAIWVALN